MGGKRTAGPTGRFVGDWEVEISIQAARGRYSPVPRLHHRFLSFEANCLISPAFDYRSADENLGYLLRKYRVRIEESERKFHVDRRAIAGAVAWEALENPKPAFLSRGFGLGEPHVSVGRFEWTTAVEREGILRPQVAQERAALLQAPETAIEYIAAIMDLIAHVYEKKFPPRGLGESLRSKPEILANVYQGRNEKSWREQVGGMAASHKPRPATTMAVWVLTNLRFLENCVGCPAIDMLIRCDQEGHFRRNEGL